ncbi:DUF1194 domain-containing protein [Rhodoligotrophos defluvii]|uniref:DUF1194 domain-containing protein n=1 Tax=Rhodoligotrophos defluvii TaxID=2561934 RepID=UPI0014859337|nr:DUF1194 domain-containing protein [Rhodoligotrophos defluvii]
MMLRTLFSLLAFVMMLPSATRAADADVDLELVLAVDVSWSMDLDEQALQREGYVEALKHPEVISAIGSGLTGRIALTYVEWAGPGYETVLVPWTVIDGAAAARAFADALASAPISRYRATSISSALQFAAPLFESNGFNGLRQVIDISGDGPNNMGAPVLTARDAVLARGIVINGLPIMIKSAGGFYSIDNLDAYYEQCVIGGPGSFIVPVQELSTIAEAIRRKLVLEIVGREPDTARVIHASETTSTSEPFDCLIGEKLYQRWMQ